MLEADLWIVPAETRSFENGATLPGHERYLALSTPGVAAATEVVVSFAEWRKPSGGRDPGGPRRRRARRRRAPRPGTSSTARPRRSRTPDAVVVDRTYLRDLGLWRVGDKAEIIGP